MSVGQLLQLDKASLEELEMARIENGVEVLAPISKGDVTVKKCQPLGMLLLGCLCRCRVRSWLAKRSKYILLWENACKDYFRWWSLDLNSDSVDMKVV